MTFIAFYYDKIRDLLKKYNRVMKLEDAISLSLMPEIDFLKYMPEHYKDKMIVFKCKGEEYILLATKEMINNE